MNNETMKAMFERLDDGRRIGNNAVNRRVLVQQPEANDWDENVDARLDYFAYAGERAMGKSHEEAVAWVELTRKHR